MISIGTCAVLGPLYPQNHKEGLKIKSEKSCVDREQFWEWANMFWIVILTRSSSFQTGSKWRTNHSETRDDVGKTPLT